jgi:hypothetical protein
MPKVTLHDAVLVHRDPHFAAIPGSFSVALDNAD